MLLNTAKTKFANFVSDLKAWMNSNHLQLNELKTQFVEMLPPGREHAKLIPNRNLGGRDVFSTSVSVKMLGVILDQDMSLSLHINKVINVCYLNQLISGRVDRASATETVDSGSIPGRVKPKTIKIGIHSFTA